MSENTILLSLMLDSASLVYYDGNEYLVCALSDDGVNFILKNTHLFDLQQPAIKDEVPTIVSNSDDLPF